MTANDGTIYGIDHGVTFNAEDKLRTVLWGWIGAAISTELLQDLANVETNIDASELPELLDVDEMLALKERLAQLLESKTMPSPSPHWPAVPWPVF